MAKIDKAKPRITILRALAEAESDPDVKKVALEEAEKIRKAWFGSASV